MGCIVSVGVDPNAVDFDSTLMESFVTWEGEKEGRAKWSKIAKSLIKKRVLLGQESLFLMGRDGGIFPYKLPFLIDL